MSKELLGSWRANFFAGLAVILPLVISIAVLVWLFGTVSNVTDTLLFFLPRDWTHKSATVIHWYWSLAALLLAVLLISVLGRVARHYIGRKLIELVDLMLLRVPLLNKIYSSLKQINEAFTSSNKSSFKQVVLVQFPRPGMYSVGFITSDQHDEVRAKTGENVIGVFIPTTPVPTSGFIVLLPEAEVIRLEMSVADGIRFIMSLGTIAPEYRPQLGGQFSHSLNPLAQIKPQQAGTLHGGEKR
jgi:uncharacterized membrane protein